jgi:Dyp-type peroxidase family
MGSKGSGTADAAGARIVGRWLSGAPILLSPEGDDPALANTNHFEFRADRVDVCPGNAHIRKVNPRGEFAAQERLRHRLLRRGITYGPMSQSTPDAPVDDGVERGLLFLAYMTSIRYQFEFVMESWANHQNFRTAGTGADALLSRDWIEPTGGGYFFAPSKSALTKVLSA